MILSKKQLKRQRKKERDSLAALQQPPPAAVGVNKQDNEKKRKIDQDSPWNFEVEYNDHFETPKVAYSDLLPVLLQTARDCNKTLAELVVYDPYFCAGQMVTLLHELGVRHVINSNRDFYADVATGIVPEHDILVTNPPYSGEHKQKLLQYLSGANKPFCLLLPVYVAAKSYWRDFLAAQQVKSDTNRAAGASAARGSPDLKLQALYLLPPISYEYNHPEGTGKDLPPFFSCWFVGGAFQSLMAVRKTVLSPEHNSQRCLAVCISVESLIKRGVISSDSVKRPNPKQRRKKLKNSNSMCDAAGS